MFKQPISCSSKCTDNNLHIGGLLQYGKEHSPDVAALSDYKTSLSFGELDLVTDKYAKYLKYLYGINPGDIVCVVGKKSVDTVSILIAIWKIGAVYCPIDCKAGNDRIKLITSLIKPKIVLTELNLENGVIDDSVLTKTYQELFSYNDDIQQNLILHAHKPDDLLYIIFTSGSTGIPKGVMINADSFRHYAYAHQKWLKFGLGDRIVSLTPIHFDVFIEDTILPLANGTHVYQYDSLYSGFFLRKLLEKQKVSHVIAVSSLLAIISEDVSFLKKNKLPKLKILMTGAETCSVELINQWKIAFPQVSIINAYGPTETTIVSHCFEIKEIDKNLKTSYPIGKPLEGISCILLDEQGNEIVEPYIPGELLIGGPQVMAGYIGDEKLSNKVIKTINGIRYYCSGDICTSDQDGNYIFLERNDLQVKLNGKRLHLGEVHSAILNMKGVKQCALGIVKHRNISTIGCVVVGVNKKNIHEIKEHINKTINHLITPKVWGIFDEPLVTLNGKSDNKKLIELLQNNINNELTVFNLNGKYSDEK